MPKPTPEDRARFQTYVRDAAGSVANLGFLLDNLGTRVTLDYSVQSLAQAEAIYWRCVAQGMAADLSDLDHFAQLLGQYLGQCVIHHTGAKWVQSTDHNPMFGQPCLDGFGGQPWDRIYPVHTALHLRDLPQSKPWFAGVREQRVFAVRLEQALAIHAQSRERNQAGA